MVPAINKTASNIHITAAAANGNAGNQRIIFAANVCPTLLRKYPAVMSSVRRPGNINNSIRPVDVMPSNAPLLFH